MKTILLTDLELSDMLQNAALLGARMALQEIRDTQTKTTIEMSTSQAAKHFEVTTNTIRRWCNKQTPSPTGFSATDTGTRWVINVEV